MFFVCRFARALQRNLNRPRQGVKRKISNIAHCTPDESSASQLDDLSVTTDEMTTQTDTAGDVCYKQELGKPSTVTFDELKAVMNDIDQHGFVFCKSSPGITFLKLDISDRLNPVIAISVVIDCDFSAYVNVFGSPLSMQNTVLKQLPPAFSTKQAIASLLHVLNNSCICCAVNDPNLLQMARSTKGLIVTDSCVRSAQCELLLSNRTRCVHCTLARKLLDMRYRRSKHSHARPCMVMSKRPNSSLPSPLKRAKLAHLARKAKGLGSQVTYLKSKLQRYEKQSQDSISSSGLKLQDNDCDLMLNLIDECKDSFSADFEKNSFQQIFFQQQLKYNNLKKKSSMRWHPTIIRWCLYVKSKSSKAYDGIRSFLHLPSNRTLYDYSHYMEHGFGVNPKVTEQLIQKATKLGCYKAGEQHKSYVGILHDEIKIKSDLVYHKVTGEIVGYVNLDQVANEMGNLECATGTEKKLAEYLLVVMVRGITTGLRYPFASYATTTASCTSLSTILWECVEYLEIVAGLKVLYVCCDGAVQNRKFFKLHSYGDDVPYKTKNLYAENRDIFFISDPPHLLKTARNCFANSFSHAQSRTLWFEQTISWKDIVNLYEQHCENSVFRMCPKLTRNHVELTSFSKMKVSLAAQVLSSTVANALEQVRGDGVRSTVKFIRMVNKWFDIVNVKNLYEGRNSRNPDLNAFCDQNDPRLAWLETSFLTYLYEWKAAALKRPGKFTTKDRQRMQLSEQTMLGFQISCKSIAAIVRFILAAGAPFVLTNHLNQDPLEQLFGHCRHKGGSNQNPTADEASRSVNTIRAVSTQAVANVLGNTSSAGPVELDLTPVPKRNSHKSKLPCRLKLK